MAELKTSHYRGITAAYLIVGILALVGGAVSLNYRVKSIAPYLFSLDPTPGPIETEAQKRLKELAEMRLLDSDSDGLNDFDEEYTYSTSAYLADSDSDGVDDATEITAGDNPNCPTGVTCEQARTATNANENANTNETTSPANLATDDPDKLREQLADLGIPKSVLDQVGDDDLVSVYSSVAADYPTGNVNVNTNSAVIANTNENVNAELLPTNSANEDLSSASTLEDFQDFSADEIRTFLIASGISEDDLNQVNDDTLLQLFQDALEEQENEQK